MPEYCGLPDCGLNRGQDHCPDCDQIRLTPVQPHGRGLHRVTGIEPERASSLDLPPTDALPVLDTRPVTVTLPVAQWTALRGAARQTARKDRRRIDRRRIEGVRLSGRDLDAQRADLLEDAASTIHRVLEDSNASH